MTVFPAGLAGAPALELGRRAAASVIYRQLLSVILWLFFFNGLADRLIRFFIGTAFFTDAYYLLIGAAVALRLLMALRRGSDSPLALWALFGLVFVTGLGALYGNPVASIFGVKQFFLGFIFLFLFAGQPLPAGTLLRALLLVQAYALFQGIYFLTQDYTLPPWDLVYVQELIRSWGARNLFQQELIRPFATFASFAEYEIVSHMLGAYLFLMRRQLPRVARVGVWVVVLSLVTIDRLLPDRTPVMMAAITLATTWLGVTLVHGGRTHPRRLVLGLILLVTFLAAFWVVPAQLLNSETFALRRMGEALRFWQAETVRERAAVAWSLSLDVIRAQPEGVGPAAVATSYQPDAMVPHNNYLLFAIGYSVAFPFLFVGGLLAMFWRVFVSAFSPDAHRARVGFCGIGVTLAYLVSSLFNATFSSYMGAAYFLLMLWLHAELGPPRPLPLPRQP